jgi:hypothetical protein
MIDFIRQYWPALAGGLAALIAGGLAVRFLWARSGRDTNIVNQKGATATGDIVGRDKVTRETNRT